MIRSIYRIAILVCGLFVAFAATAQSSAAADKPSVVIVSIYHVAPGKQLEFLKWIAARDAVAKEAGLPPSRWYAHMDGDSWDYIGISPATTDEQDAKVDALSKAKGLTTGFKSSLEFRSLVASHTDTYAAETSAAALVEAATK